MFPNFRNGPPWDGPLWLTIPTVTARAHVMMAMAIGMVSVATGLKLDDALAALRAHAYAVDRTVDSIDRPGHRAPKPAGVVKTTRVRIHVTYSPGLRCGRDTA